MSGKLVTDTDITLAKFTALGGSIIGTGDITIASEGVFDFTGTTFNTSGDVTIQGNGTLNWRNGGRMGGSGTTTIRRGGFLTIVGELSEQMSIEGTRSVVNDGTATMSGGRLQGNLGGSFTNTHVMNLTGDGTIDGVAGFPFTNSGTLTKSEGTGMFTLNGDLLNTGTLEVDSGTLTARQLAVVPPEQTGSVIVASEATLELLVGEFRFVAPASITGGGTLHVGIQAEQGSATLPPTFTLPEISMSGKLVTDTDITLAKFTALGGSIIGTGDITIASEGVFDFTGTLLDSSGTLTIGAKGILNWMGGGRMGGSGTTIIEPDGRTYVSELGAIEGSRSIVNQGTFTLTGADLTATGGSFLNAGSVVVEGDFSIARLGIGFVFTNEGSLVKEQGSGVSTIGSDLVNIGTIEVLTGKIETGTLTSYPEGGLSFELRGTVPWIEHGQLSVAGAASLDGTLALTLGTGYVPPPGSTFVVIACESCGGTFDVIEDPPGGPSFGVTYTLTHVTVTAD
jgi:hypothetical protein